MARELSITVAPDEAPVPALTVKLLLTGCGFAFGALVAMVASWHGSGDSPESMAASEARFIADEIEHDMQMGGSCTDALTEVGMRLVRDDGDAWGRRWSVRCHGELGVVQSPGRDGQWRTKDDIVALASPNP